METVVSQGISSLYEFGALVTVLVLVVVALLYDRKNLIARNNDLQDKLVGMLVENIKAITEFKEVLRDVSSRH